MHTKEVLYKTTRAEYGVEWNPISIDAYLRTSFYAAGQIYSLSTTLRDACWPSDKETPLEHFRSLAIY